MKKLLLLSTLSLFLTTINYGQYDSSRVKQLNGNLQERLMLKSKKQKTTAWALLSAGIAVDALSFAFRPKDSDSFSDGFDKIFLSAGLLIVGTAGIISSIPVFIVSGVNKRKARIIINADRVELLPRLKSSEWQFKTGLAISF